jgi:flagellar biogenesis protein FliO
MRGRFLLMAATSIALPTAAGAQQIGGGGAPDVSLFRVFLALLVCVIVAVLVVLFVKQRMGGRLPRFLGRIAPSQGRIRLIEGRRISPQGELCICEVDGEEFVLLLSPGGALLLDRRRQGRGA